MGSTIYAFYKDQKLREKIAEEEAEQAVEQAVEPESEKVVEETKATKASGVAEKKDKKAKSRKV